MYEAFYGLRELPFRLTPDPQYLFLSEHHREALGHLLFGIREDAGFVAVTGEIGTGKTTLLRTLLRELETGTVVAYIFNPALSDLELLQTINSEFALPSASTSKKELVDELNRFLVAEKQRGHRVIVIVDEAQNLAPSVLEQLRMLSNLETETQKLLQIVLVGQPELRHMLGRPDLKQLNQRITVRWHLEALDRAETAAYVRHRLGVAGSSAAATIFTPGALRLIYGYARGVPRLINIVAHRALLIGYTEERRPIGARLVGRAIRELRRDDAGARPSRRFNAALGWRAIGATLAAALIAVGAAFSTLRPAVSPPTAGNAPSAAAPSANPGSPVQLGDVRANDAVPPYQRTVADEVKEPESKDAESASLAANAIDAAAAPTAIATPALVAEPAPSPTPPATDALWTALAAMDHRDAAVAAVDELLAAWKVDPLQPEEHRAPSLDLEAIAERRGLRYLPTSGNLARLQLLNLPAILELSLPQSGQRRFALLARVDGDGPVMRLGETQVVMSADQMGLTWLGDAHVFWRDFERLPPYLALGSVGPEVERLHGLLTQLGEYDEDPSRLYDHATAEAIARFQRSHRLPPDGIVGPLTKILLYDGVAGYEHPRLNGDT